jgi:uncharacterized membrane-anchored protein YitT (DUF2179 family)
MSERALGWYMRVVSFCCFCELPRCFRAVFSLRALFSAAVFIDIRVPIKRKKKGLLINDKEATRIEEAKKNKVNTIITQAI